MDKKKIVIDRARLEFVKPLNHEEHTLSYSDLFASGLITDLMY